MKKALALLFSFALLGFWAIYAPRVIPYCALFNSLIHYLGGFLSAFVFPVIFILVSWAEGLFVPNWKFDPLERAGFFIRSLLLLFSSAFFGVLWESWEFHHFGEEMLSLWTCLTLHADTVKDLEMDILGGLSAAIIYELIRKD